jgi:hypothetical protein
VGFHRPGQALETNFAEAVVLSLMAYETLKCNPIIRPFELPEHWVDPKTFRLFLDFALSRVPVSLTRDAARSFIPVCAFLGNERLALALLSSAKIESSDSPIDVSDSTIDICASHFYSYSAEDLRGLGRSALHRLLSSRSFSIDSEDALLRLLIEIGWEKSEFWSYVERRFLSSEGISVFAENLSVDEMTEWIWGKTVMRLKGACDEDLRKRRFRRRVIDSAILMEILDVLNDIGGGDRGWTLLYRGSRDGFRSSDFHGKCDGQRNTVTVILTTKGAIAGGFTPLAWDSQSSTGEYRADDSGQSFLFTLKTAGNGPPRKFSLSSRTHAICCTPGNGPTFGGNHDLCVADGCHGNASSYTNVGPYSANGTGVNGQQVLFGEFKFIVKELEVFGRDIGH